MRCPNCQSKDIVAIQGQSYCINCGQLVADQSPKNERKTIASLVKVGISVPDQAPDPSDAPNKTLQASPKEPVHAEERSKQAPKRGLLSIGHKTPPVKLDETAIPVKQVATDIVPTRATDARVVDLTPPAVTVQPAKITSPASKIGSHPFRTSVGLASIIAAPIAIGVALAMYLHVDADILVFAVLPAALIAVGTTATLAQAALMYGLAKRHDGRGIDRKGWWQMAGQSATELLQLNILTMLVVGVLAAAGYASWHGSGQLLSTLPVVRGILLGVINAFLIWLIAGALVARRLAGAAVVVNDIPLFTALRLGIGMYWRIGGHLLAATGESLGVKLMSAGALAVLAGGCVYLARVLPPVALPAVYAVAVFLGLVTVLSVGLHIEVRLWLSQYRHWAPLCFPDKRKSMLAKPRNLRAKTS